MSLQKLVIFSLDMMEERLKVSPSEQYLTVDCTR